VETLHTTDKGRIMDTLERFYIFQETKINNQINDRLTIKPNIIFETTDQKDPHRGPPTAYKHINNSIDSVLQRATEISPEGHPPPTGTIARCHCNATKQTVATIYNP